MRALAAVSLISVCLACTHSNVRHDPIEGVEFIPLPGVQPGERDLYIGRGEVSVRAYRGCTAHGPCTKEPLERSAQRQGKEACAGGGQDPEQPLNCVSFDEAAAFCTWLRGRLPTADEWERAAHRTGGDAIVSGLSDWTSTGTDQARQVRRGNWTSADDTQRSWSSGARPPLGFGAEVGFRCVQDAN